MKALITLIVLLALPFSVEAQSEHDLTWQDVFPDTVWLIPTFEVYCIDTVGWEEVSRDSTTHDFAVWDMGNVLPRYDNPAERKTQWLITIKSRPILDTIIIAHFQADAETTKINKWRVRAK